MAHKMLDKHNLAFILILNTKTQVKASLPLEVFLLTIIIIKYSGEWIE
jgi:hypothetical protein